MSESIKLNFINNSNDTNNSSVVIFQKNVATSFDEVAVAWQVIKNCGVGSHHPFYYPMQNFVGAEDSYGNFTPQIAATNGQAFHVIRDTSGDVLRFCGAASNYQEIEIRNDLMQGSINAQIYKDGKLLAVKTGVAPGQKAVFEFKPTIFIGVASQINEGDIMNSAILSDINTELNLLGIASADIVMTGGGVGPQATPFTFTLSNINFSSSMTANDSDNADAAPGQVSGE